MHINEQRTMDFMEWYCVFCTWMIGNFNYNDAARSEEQLYVYM